MPWAQVVTPYDYTKLYTLAEAENMQKKQYEQIAAAVRDMREGFRLACSQENGPTTDQLMEIVTARLGLMLARDNPNFDSFKFAAKCIVVP